MHCKRDGTRAGLHCSGGKLPESGAVVCRKAVAKDFHLGPVVHARNGLHEVAGGVIAEVGRDVSNAQAAVRCELAAELVRRLVEYAHL